jgi:hypothetical protein
MERNISKYMIFCKTEDNESVVLEDTDNWLRSKFNSSDIYGKMKENASYTITVVGYRIPFLSMYENILSVEEEN